MAFIRLKGWWESRKPLIKIPSLKAASGLRWISKESPGVHLRRPKTRLINSRQDSSLSLEVESRKLTENSQTRVWSSYTNSETWGNYNLTGKWTRLANESAWQSQALVYLGLNTLRSSQAQKRCVKLPAVHRSNHEDVHRQWRLTATILLCDISLHISKTSVIQNPNKEKHVPRQSGNGLSQ